MESRVCALLMQRLTEQRVADHLERSPNTVHVHVRNIYRKLGVRTRKELYEYPGIINMIVKNMNPQQESGAPGAG
ncbi:MAG: helix-turn-helix transcriptional regulator [Phycisphaeraceae bacterium]